MNALTCWPGCTLRILPESLLPGEIIACSLQETPFGPVLAASTSLGLCWASPASDEASAIERLRKRFTGAVLQNTETKHHRLFRNVFEGENIWLDLHLHGTPFQRIVWNALLQIPMGQTITYGALAKAIGHPEAFRATGTAVGANPVFAAIPCHRVLPASGGIGNYLWGAKLKQEILAWENRHK